MHRIHWLCFGVILMLGCQTDRGERLFEINYPFIDFTVPAGVSWPSSWVISKNGVPARLTESLQENGLSPDQVTAIGGAYARVSTLDGNDLGDFSQISLRICPAGPDACTEADEVFFIGDLYRRRQNVVNLNPNNRNLKPLLTSQGQYKLELLLLPAQATTTNVRCRLDYSFEAVE